LASVKHAERTDRIWQLFHHDLAEIPVLSVVLGPNGLIASSTVHRATHPHRTKETFMANQEKPLPEYRKHDLNNNAVVTIDGADFELGRYGSVASRNRYDRLVTEWIANGRLLPAAQANKTLTVKKLVAAFRGFAKQYYRGSTEAVNLEHCFKPLVELYGSLPASDFGPLKLKAVRQKMIEADLCRAEINKRIGRVKRIFRWATENEVLSPTVFHGLQSVRGLARGRSEARESEPVRPVPEAFVDALKTHLPPQIWAMVELQRLTGMRPGEVTIMRTCDLDTSGRVWVYIPSRHKTACHGHSRQIYLGPRAQEVLRPWLHRETTAFLFQPKDVMEAIRVLRHKARKTPLSCGHRPGNNVKAKPKKSPGEVYKTQAYGRAIITACDKASVPHWHPHQLRHNAATWLRKEFGLDVARVVLGHRSPAITEQYAEIDFGKAQEIMGRVG
jgi:integrase